MLRRPSVVSGAARRAAVVSVAPSGWMKEMPTRPCFPYNHIGHDTDNVPEPLAQPSGIFTGSVAVILRDILDPDVVSVTPDMRLDEAVRLLRQYRMAFAPVIHHGRVVGTVSLASLQGADARKAVHVRDIGYAAYQALPPDTELRQAMEHAARTGAEHLLILEQGRLIGIVSTARLGLASDPKGSASA